VPERYQADIEAAVAIADRLEFAAVPDALPAPATDALPYAGVILDGPVWAGAEEWVPYLKQLAQLPPCSAVAFEVARSADELAAARTQPGTSTALLASWAAALERLQARLATAASEAR